MGLVAIYAGLVAHPGYLLQQKHNCSRLCLLHCKAHALVPGCHVQASQAACCISLMLRLLHCTALLLLFCLRAMCKLCMLQLLSLQSPDLLSPDFIGPL